MVFTASRASDRYRIVLKEQGEAPRVLFDRRVNYETSYPNGKECDVVCRHARYDLCRPQQCPDRSSFEPRETERVLPASPSGMDSGLADSSTRTPAEKEGS